MGSLTGDLRDLISAVDAEHDAAALTEVSSRLAAGSEIQPTLEIASCRQLLRLDPDDPVQWFRFWQLLLLVDGEVEPRIEAAILMRALENAERRPGSRDNAWLASVSRQILVVSANASLALPAAALRNAWRDAPAEDVLVGFFLHLQRSPNPSAAGEVAEAGLAAMPASNYCLEFAAQHWFDIGRTDEMVRRLSRRQDRTLASPGLTELLYLALQAEGRSMEASEVLNKHFARTRSDLWRNPGFAEAQKDAIERQIPPILIITQPKSGTLFTQNTLSQGLNCPHTSIFPRRVLFQYDIIPARLEEFSAGGCVALEHMHAKPEFLSVLWDANVRRFSVNLRDPRQAALSSVHQLAFREYSQADPGDRHRAFRSRLRDPENFEAQYFKQLASSCDFQEEWFAFFRSTHRFEVQVTDFDDLGDERAYINGLLRFFQIDQSKFDINVFDRDMKERAAHFRKGLRREWEETISPTGQEEISRIINLRPGVAEYVRRKDECLG